MFYANLLYPVECLDRVYYINQAKESFAESEINEQTLQKMLCYIFYLFFSYYILCSDVVDLASEIIRLVFFLSKYNDDFKASFHRSL